MFGRKASFWVAVGGVSVLSQFALELLSDKVHVEGLQRFVSYIHRGPSA